MTLPFRYKKLGYVALNVHDLERSTAFYRDLVGLDASHGVPGKMSFLRCSRDHHNLILYQAAEPGLKRIGFELERGDDLEAARAHLSSLGIEVLDVPEEERRLLRQRDALRFVVPHCGAMLELYSGITYMAAP